ncbi:MAG: hypothetical protein ACTTKI_04485 [Tannerella sp.]|uniref:hypothetical protein n=1 Tax=Tannerella sp. TaxID=2382127 RepID=UPI003FA2B35C
MGRNFVLNARYIISGQLKSLDFSVERSGGIKKMRIFAAQFSRTKFYLIIQTWQQELDCKDSVVKATPFIRSLLQTAGLHEMESLLKGSVLIIRTPILPQ